MKHIMNWLGYYLIDLAKNQGANNDISIEIDSDDKPFVIDNESGRVWEIRLEELK